MVVFRLVFVYAYGRSFGVLLFSQHLVSPASAMSCSSGCGAYCFLRAGLPVWLFGEYDAAAAESARRLRFLRRRADSEFLEKVILPEPAPAPASSPPVSLRRSRRVLGLSPEYETIEPPHRRPRLS